MLVWFFFILEILKNTVQWFCSIFNLNKRSIWLPVPHLPWNETSYSEFLLHCWEKFLSLHLNDLFKYMCFIHFIFKMLINEKNSKNLFIISVALSTSWRHFSSCPVFVSLAKMLKLTALSLSSFGENAELSLFF